MYIYLIIDNKTKNTPSVFKIGMTNQDNLNKRTIAYPKDSTLLLGININCVNAERNLLKKFKIKFIQRKDYGREYFEGDQQEMIDIIMDYSRGIAEVKANVKVEVKAEVKANVENDIIILDCNIMEDCTMLQLKSTHTPSQSTTQISPTLPSPPLQSTDITLIHCINILVSEYSQGNLDLINGINQLYNMIKSYYSKESKEIIKLYELYMNVTNYQSKPISSL